MDTEIFIKLLCYGSWLSLEKSCKNHNTFKQDICAGEQEGRDKILMQLPLLWFLRVETFHVDSQLKLQSIRK